MAIPLPRGIDTKRDSAIYRNPVYHQAVFATLVLITATRTMYLIHSDISKNVPPVVKKRIGKIYQTGLLTFLAGFAIWNVDNIYCSTLTEWKKAVGWPIAFLLEGARSFSVPLPISSVETYK